jgi:hypothetical protein
LRKKGALLLKLFYDCCRLFLFARRQAPFSCRLRRQKAPPAPLWSASWPWRSSGRESLAAPRQKGAFFVEIFSVAAGKSCSKRRISLSGWAAFLKKLAVLFFRQEKTESSSKYVG